VCDNVNELICKYSTQTTFSTEFWIWRVFSDIDDLDHKLVIRLPVNTSANDTVCTPVTDDNKLSSTNEYSFCLKQHVHDNYSSAEKCTRITDLSSCVYSYTQCAINRLTMNWKCALQCTVFRNHNTKTSLVSVLVWCVMFAVLLIENCNRSNSNRSNSNPKLSTEGCLWRLRCCLFYGV